MKWQIRKIKELITVKLFYSCLINRLVYKRLEYAVCKGCRFRKIQCPHYGRGAVFR